MDFHGVNIYGTKPDFNQLIIENKNKYNEITKDVLSLDYYYSDDALYSTKPLEVYGSTFNRRMDIVRYAEDTFDLIKDLKRTGDTSKVAEAVKLTGNIENLKHIFERLVHIGNRIGYDDSLTDFPSQ